MRSTPNRGVALELKLLYNTTLSQWGLTSAFYFSTNLTMHCAMGLKSAIRSPSDAKLVRYRLDLISTSCVYPGCNCLTPANVVSFTRHYIYLAALEKKQAY